MNLTGQTIRRNGKEEQLSFYEVELLRLLHERVGQPVSREVILTKMWGLEASSTTRTIDAFIEKLRRKSSGSPRSRTTSSRCTGKGTSSFLTGNAFRGMAMVTQ